MGKLIQRLSVILFIVGLGVLFSAVFDPYGVFHPKNCRDYNNLSVNQRYVKINYILDNPNKYDTLLFGSSRVGGIDVNNLNNEEYGNCYNMTYSGGTPVDHLEDLYYLIENDAAPDRVLLGFDDGSIVSINQNTHTNLLRRPYPYDGDYIRHYIDYLNPTVGFKALINGGFDNLSIMFSGMFNGRKKEYLYIDGQNSIEPYRSVENWLNVSEEEHIAMMSKIPKYPPVLSEEKCSKTRDTLFEIADLCAENDIEIIFIAIPNHVSYFCGYSEEFVAFLCDLSQEIEFINFIGVNSVTTNPFNYYECEHFCPSAGDYVVSVLNGESLDQGPYDQYLGVVINRENADDFAVVMLKNAAKYIKDHS